jgi:REP element-mobilizing transposase RayT
LKEIDNFFIEIFMPRSTYFVTFCTWERLELNLAARQVVMETCQYFHGERYAIFTGVVMPDHVHLLIQPWLQDTGKFWTLGSILRSIKGFNAKQIPAVMPHIGKLWQDGRHERLILGDRHFQSAVNYIHQNPVEAQIVKPSEIYPYCWSNLSIEPSASVSLASKQQHILPVLSTHPKTLKLLRDCALNDPDEQLREWAQEQLKIQNVKLKEEA